MYLQGNSFTVNAWLHNFQCVTFKVRTGATKIIPPCTSTRVGGRATNVFLQDKIISLNLYLTLSSHDIFQNTDVIIMFLRCQMESKISVIENIHQVFRYRVTQDG